MSGVGCKKHGASAQGASADARHDPPLEAVGKPRFDDGKRVARSAQYSSANMIVITRSVTDGSDGSGEW